MSGRRRRGEDEFAAEQPWLAEDDAGRWPPEDDDAGPWPPPDDAAGGWPPQDDDSWPAGAEQVSAGGRRGRHSARPGLPADPGGWEPTASVPRQAGQRGQPASGTAPGWEEPGWDDPGREDRFALRHEPDPPPSRRSAAWDQDAPAGGRYPGGTAESGLPGGSGYAGPPGPEPGGRDPGPAAAGRVSRRAGRRAMPADVDPRAPGGYQDAGDRYAGPDDPGTDPLERPAGRSGDPGSRYGGGRSRSDRAARYGDSGGRYGDSGGRYGGDDGRYSDQGGRYGEPGGWDREPGGWDREPLDQYGVLGGQYGGGSESWDREPAGSDGVPDDRDAGLGGRYQDPGVPYGDADDPGPHYGDPAGPPADRGRGYSDPGEWPDAPSGRRPDSRDRYAGAGDGYPPPGRGGTGGYPGAGARRAGPGGDEYRDTARGLAAEQPGHRWEDRDDPDDSQDAGWPFGGGAGDDDSRGRPRRKRRGRWAGPSSLLIVAAIILIPLIIGGIYAYRVISAHYDPPNYSGNGTGTVIFQVKPGDNSETVGARLVADGVVASSRALVLAAEHSSNTNELEPGYYRLHKHMNAQLAWNLLLSPSARVQLKVTIPEGWRVSQIVTALGKQSGIPASDYTKALKDTKALGLPSYAKGNPEGYLFPDTYEIQPHSTAISVLKAMVSAFNQEAASVNLPKAAAHGNLTQAEAIVVASLAQAEGGKDSDFPKITRVIYNRLAAHMPLDLDSTVLYALNTYGIVASNQQLKVKSPYNTYAHQGLPPGPIDSPGNAAIQAALHPAHGNWLYFVTVNPKTKQTDFTSSPAVFQQLKNELDRNLAHGG